MAKEGLLSCWIYSNVSTTTISIYPNILGKILTRKWIRQMLPCRPHHVGAPVWNLIGYSMVSLCGSPSGPDMYLSLVAWLSRSLQALSDIPPLVSYCKPCPDARGLYLSGLNIPQLLGPNPLCQMWNNDKKDPRILMLYGVQVLQRVLIWERQCHHMTLEISIFLMCQIVPTR